MLPAAYTPTLAERLDHATRLLQPVTDTPRLDAELLLAHSMGIGRAHLLARLQECVNVQGFSEVLERRLAFEPLAYILREWEFFSLQFKVEPPLLVPRPETEHLVEVVRRHVGHLPADILEIGTGTGCVTVTLAKLAPSAHLIATDINPQALAVAADNAQRHGVRGRINFKQGDLFAALESPDQEFDVICSNPPYIEEPAWDDLPAVIRLHEDPRALLAGPEGLDVIARILFSATAYLRPGGLLAIEIGMGQDEAVRALFDENNYEGIGFEKDLAGIPRIAFAFKSVR